MDQSGILGIVGIVIGVLATIIGYINHTRIRSNCFGLKSELSLDIDKRKYLRFDFVPNNSIPNIYNRFIGFKYDKDS